jgi:hypothetical protein
MFISTNLKKIKFIPILLIALSVPISSGSDNSIFGSVLPCVGQVDYDGLLKEFPINSNGNRKKNRLINDSIVKNKSICKQNKDTCTEFFNQFKNDEKLFEKLEQTPDFIERGIRGQLTDVELNKIIKSKKPAESVKVAARVRIKGIKGRLGGALDVHHTQCFKTVGVLEKCQKFLDLIEQSELPEAIAQYFPADFLQRGMSGRYENIEDLGDELRRLRESYDEWIKDPRRSTRPSSSVDTNYGHRVVPDQHPSVFPDNQTKSLIDRNSSYKSLLSLCTRKGIPPKSCMALNPEEMRRIMREVDDKVFFSLIGREHGELEELDVANMYIASATDPLSGVYSIRQNRMPKDNGADVFRDVLEEQAPHRSDAISSAHEDLMANRQQYFAEGIRGEGRSANSDIHEMYRDTRVKNGAAGTHAEVLASNGVLKFKDDVGRCLYSSKRKRCSGIIAEFSCIKSKSCSYKQWQKIGKKYKVEIPSKDSFSKCVRKPIECFKRPPPGGSKPDELFFDVRGGNQTTASIADGGNVISVKDKPSVIPGENLAKDLRVDSTPPHVENLLKQNNLNQSLVSDVRTKVKKACAGRNNGCEVAYYRSVAYFCKENPRGCKNSVPDLEEARRAVTAKVTGQKNTPDIQFGAGERCFHCWHLLGRQNFTSTLNTGAAVHRH